MPTALDEPWTRLFATLPIAKVIDTPNELGYDPQVSGSHRHLRKADARRLTFTVRR